jgi:hypothetical protein
MKTIAIIGGGIAARSVLFTMAKKNLLHKVLVFQSESFAFPCSLHSTAIVAPRGISTGHSSLGDNLVSGFIRFSKHIAEDSPEGVIKVPQYTGALTKIDQFQKRYPDGALTKSCGSISLNTEMYVAREEAFLIRPRDYMNWLMKESQSSLNISVVESFVTEVKDGKIRTINGDEYSADEVIFTTGVNNDLWQTMFPENKNTKSAQGCYLEFSGVYLGKDPFSLTLEGNNLIYDAEKNSLLMGSTTHESRLELAPEKELFEIYEELQKIVSEKLPDFKKGIIRTGLREKASKREPYLLRNGNYSMIGGLYKNGYRLSLKMAEDLLS